jgi:hypothetical protein
MLPQGLLVRDESPQYAWRARLAWPNRCVAAQIPGRLMIVVEQEGSPTCKCFSKGSAEWNSYERHFASSQRGSGSLSARGGLPLCPKLVIVMIKSVASGANDNTRRWRGVRALEFEFRNERVTALLRGPLNARRVRLPRRPGERIRHRTHYADKEVAQPAPVYFYGFQPITVHSAKAAMESSHSAQVEMSSLR